MPDADNGMGHGDSSVVSSAHFRHTRSSFQGNFRAVIYRVLRYLAGGNHPPGRISAFAVSIGYCDGSCWPCNCDRSPIYNIGAYNMAVVYCTGREIKCYSLESV